MSIGKLDEAFVSSMINTQHQRRGILLVFGHILELLLLRVRVCAQLTPELICLPKKGINSQA